MASGPCLSVGPLGALPDGRAVAVFTLRNPRGVEAAISTHRGTLLTFRVPDRSGGHADVVLGTAGVIRPPKWPYFGTIIGRYANRIAFGRFRLDGRVYAVTTNNGAHHLHGGTIGWDQAVWNAEPFEEAGCRGVRLSHTSPDGDQGFPGTVRAVATYTLDDGNSLTLDLAATTDRPTVINLTQHNYFNLSPSESPDILAHELTVDADVYTPTDATAIPLGEHAPVAGTPFDFRQPQAMGARIDQAHEQLVNGRGYDHNFVVRRTGPGLVRAARLADPRSGRALEVWTTEPGLQVYSGNYLDGSIIGKHGRPYVHRAGLSLEAQHFPDSPNRPDFPSTTLRPGDDWRSTTRWVIET